MDWSLGLEDERDGNHCPVYITGQSLFMHRGTIMNFLLHSAMQLVLLLANIIKSPHIHLLLG